MEALGAFAAVVGAAATAVLGLIAYRLSQQTQRYSAQRSIGDLQTAMARLRAEYPDVLAQSTQWGAHESAVLYGRAVSSERDRIVQYYSYIDLGLEFCNTALAAHSKGWIDEDVFRKHYRPLVRHFLAENQPFVSFSSAGPYLSDYIRDEVATAEAEGWDWAEKHRLLGESPAEQRNDSDVPRRDGS